MAEFNIPNKKNYNVLAGSSVFIARYDVNDVLGEYNFVGNLAADPTLSADLTRLEHFTNLYGVLTRDRNPVIQKGMNFSFVIDELVRENLEYVLGSSGRVVNQSINVKNYAKVTFAAGTAQVNSGNAIVSVLKILPNSGEDVYTEGATGDYTVNLSNGTITLTGASDISNGDTCIVLFEVAKTAAKYPIMDDPNISGAIQFVNLKSSANELGYNIFLELPNVDIALDGDIPLPRETWMQATLLCSALADATAPTGKLGDWYQWRD